MLSPNCDPKASAPKYLPVSAVMPLFCNFASFEPTSSSMGNFLVINFLKATGAPSISLAAYKPPTPPMAPKIGLLTI